MKQNLPEYSVGLHELRPSSSGDPQDDFERAQVTLPYISKEAKRLMVLAAATTYGTCKLIDLFRKKETRGIKNVTQTAIAATIAATAWSQYNRLENSDLEVAEISY
jgi:hypothetical protein